MNEVVETRIKLAEIIVYLQTIKDMADFCLKEINAKKRGRPLGSKNKPKVKRK